ncbi:factor of DNA methylation 1-like [Dendrobium catenatum]|uniref:RRM domain-containing protein n=1 Tax=Dendrobium catenatum TaxID=906689 RepID=A0A2I0VXP4_9ASPA|nr:factor of DNA methylation 1-like [Dendrobium catenatum]XP_028555306.1 factor of DNA methylation 1-like [Dendrobium catenatum]PKU68187.1 hypothetical protein MA16_Dca012856 [Dendrobium catenatum]
MENCSHESATLKKDTADEDSMKLMEEQKREKEVALARIHQLERELVEKQKLEFEIAQLKGKVKVIEHYLHGEEDIYKLVDKIHKQRVEEKKGTEELQDTLLMERMANQTLCEARVEIIGDLTKMLKGPTLIGIKRMGDLDIKPFESACKKFSAEDVVMKTSGLCSSWDVEICTPSWQPSKVIENNGQIEDYRYKGLLQHSIGRGSCTSQKAKEKPNDLIFSQFLQSDLGLAVEPTNTAPIAEPKSSSLNSSSDELFLWPWMGMLVNLPMEDEYASLKEQFAQFNPVDVIASPVRDPVSMKGEAVIFFNRDTIGFRDAMAFENHFKLKRMWKKDWKEKKGANLIGIHGWIAHDDDYNSDRPLAKILRKHGEMKTVANVMEEAKENGMTVASLVKKIDVMNKYLAELNCRYNETIISRENMMDSKAKILQQHDEEMHIVKRKGREHARRNLLENDKLKLELGAKKNEIEQCCRELQKYENKNDDVKRNMDIEKEKVIYGKMCGI